MKERKNKGKKGQRRESMKERKDKGGKGWRRERIKERKYRRTGRIKERND